MSPDDQVALDELLNEGGVVRGLTFVCLPNRSKHSATIYASQPHTNHVTGTTRVNYTHYSVDSVLPQGSTPFRGSVVRVQHLFMVGDTPLVCVTWGKPLGLDTSLGCREYSFPDRSAGSSSSSSSSARSQPPCVIKAERLVSYVHFGILPGSRLLLNRFYIPRGSMDSTHQALASSSSSRGGMN